MSYTMGLYAVPKFEGCGVGEAYTVENYLDALRLGANDDKEVAAYGFKGSFVEWFLSGKDLKQDDVVRVTAETEKVYTPEMLEFYKGHYRELYWPWDIMKKFPRYRIVEEVASWQDAPQIAYWFENNVELVDGWCCPDMTDLQKLYDTCRMVVVENRELAPKLLPIPDEDAVYDAYYFDVVYATMHKVHEVLRSIDFDKYTIHFDCD